MTRSVIASERSEARQSHRGLYEIATGLRPRNDRMGGFAIFLFLLLTPYSLLFAARSRVGTTGGQFLKIAPGAREAAMAEAHTGLADSVNAIYYNPAGTAFLEDRELTAQYTRSFQSFNYEWAALALPVKKAGTFGVGIANLNVSGIERRVTDSEAPTGTFGSSDFAYIFHYARKFHQRVGAGVNLKYVRTGIDIKNAQAFAADVGLLAHLYKGSKATIGLGVAVKDFGTRLKFGVSAPTGDKLPTLYKAGLGLGWRPKDRTDVNLGLDVHIPIDNRVMVAFGGEFKRRFMSDFGLSARAGYKSGGDVDGLKGLALGGGVVWRKLGFDFGWVPFGDLGGTYRFSLLIKF